MEYDVERMRRRIDEKDAEIERLRNALKIAITLNREDEAELKQTKELLHEEDILISRKLADQKQQIVAAVKGMSTVRMPNGMKPGDALLPESEVLTAIDKACK